MHGVIGSTLDPVNHHKPLETPEINRPSLLCIIPECMFVPQCGRNVYLCTENDGKCNKKSIKEGDDFRECSLCCIKLPQSQCSYMS